MKLNQHPLIKGTLFLTLASLISRIIGFFYKIFLVSLIGAEGIGIYQMVIPIYILCVSLASSGIQTAISRHTAEKLSTGNSSHARSLFHTGVFMAVFMACTLSAGLFFLAPLLSYSLLKEPRTLPLLRLMALSIPFETLHNCANGYFLGQKKTGFPSISQLLEQIIRVGATLLLYQILLQQQTAPSPTLAVGGLLIAEISIALVTMTILAFSGKLSASPRKTMLSRTTFPENSFRLFLKKMMFFFRNDQSCVKKNTFSHKKEKPLLKTQISEILKTALPITSNRLLLNTLHSIEAALIPLFLQKYYRNSSTALSVYGTFSGMALPLIMFPCAITGSFSMILLPAVSEANALKNDRKIAATLHSSLLLCFFLGITCTSAFLLFGPSAGILLYGSTDVGNYLLTLAWICPFLYLTTTNSSILHGLGKSMTVFYQNLIGLLLRLLLSCLLIPSRGIWGVLLGLLISQLLTSFLGILALKRILTFSLQPGTLILFPCVCCLMATVFLRFVQQFLPILQNTEQWDGFLLSGGIWGITVVFCYSLFVKNRKGKTALSILS